MELSGLITALGMNLAICALLVSLYSVLRNQSSNRSIYFARCLARVQSQRQEHDPNWFERFVPSSAWIVEAWKLTEDEVLHIGGLDAVVFVKILVLSLRVFSIASIICFVLVLPVNYLGKEVKIEGINSASLEMFTIQNVAERSEWIWAHFVALHLICFSTWILLYFEYKDVAKLRLCYLRQSYRNPSRFAVLVRGVPRSYPEDNYSTSIGKFFRKYYPSSYISHRMVYRCGKMVKIMKEAERMYDIFSYQGQGALCTSSNGEVPGGSFRTLAEIPEMKPQEDPVLEIEDLTETGEESSAAFVFFRTRYAAATVAQARQSVQPMLWATSLAPEPADVYWSNLCVPYRQLWMRRIATILATTAFLFFFLVPVTIVQGLANLHRFAHALPFFKGILKKKTVNELVTGYLPGLILMVFLYTVPPIMMLFSTLEGAVSRSERKKGACVKVLHFNIWNVFFLNLLSGALVNKPPPSGAFNIPATLAIIAIPALVKFFFSYVLTSGWTSLAIELAQLYPIVMNCVYRCILRKKSGPPTGWTFPFHTEIPRVLMFTLLGFAFAVLAPLILPLLVIYFSLAFIVYRNQILNVYLFQYDTGGNYWPVVHSTIVFSMLLGQVMAIGAFAVKRAIACAVITLLLVASTLLFHEFCRQRFKPIFDGISAQEIIEMDQKDEASSREEIFTNVLSAYSQQKWVPACESTIRRSSRHPNLQVHPRAGNSIIHRTVSTARPTEGATTDQGQPLPPSKLSIEEGNK